MTIKVLGPGCNKCKTLEKLTAEIVNNLGIQAEISKEEDIMKIMQYGIMNTPGLVINGQVVLSGRIPTSKELESLITENQ